MVQLRLWLDDLTMLCFKAQRLACKWQNYQKFWYKWMQISLLDFDSKWERKEDIFNQRHHIMPFFFLIRESSEAFVLMLDLLLVVVDTVTLKYALFIKICIFQLCIELQQQQQKNLLDPFSVRWISTSGFIFLLMLILAIWKIQY